MGQGIQNGPSKICLWKIAFKKFKVIWAICLYKNLNTLTQISVRKKVALYGAFFLSGEVFIACFKLFSAQSLEGFREKQSEYWRIVDWIFPLLCRKVQLFKRCCNYKTDDSLNQISEIMDSIINGN